MPKLSDFVGSNGLLSNAMAGATIAAGVLTQIRADGRVYPVTRSDFAAVANAATLIVNPTVSTSSFQASNVNAPFGFKDQYGNLVFLSTTATASTQVSLTTISPAGVIQTATVVASSTIGNSGVFQLSNGNVLVYYTTASGAFFAIYSVSSTGAITQVLAPTLMYNSNTSTPGHAGIACPLAGGGFMTICQQAVGYDQVSVYNNAGSRTATLNTANSVNSYAEMGQLASGNVVVVSNSPRSFEEFSTAPAVAVANTAIGTLGGINGFAIGTGFWAVADGSHTVVYNDAGAVQGTAATGVNTSSIRTSPLIWDGTNFWAWEASSVVEVTTAGAIGTTYTAPSSIGAANGQGIWYAPENNTIYAGLYSSGTVNSSIVSVSLTTGNWNATPNFGAVPSGQTVSGASIPVHISDEVCYFLEYQGSNADGSFSLVKSNNTAIVGPSVGAATAGGNVEINAAAGYYPISSLQGSVTKSFNMNSTAGSNLIGNKGVVVGSNVMQLGVQ